MSTARRKILKPFFKSLNYFAVIKYAFLFFSFLIFNKLERNCLPYSACIFVSALSQGTLIIPTLLLYLGSFAFLGAVGLLGSQAILSIFISIMICVYRKFRINTGSSLVIYTLVGLLAFIFMGDTAIYISIEKRLITTLLTTSMTLLGITAMKALKCKGLKFKLAFEENVCICALTVLFGTGVCNLISPYFWRATCVFLILLVCYLFRFGVGTIISSVLSISFALFYNNLNYISLFLLLSIAVESLNSFSRYLGALSLIIVDYLIQIVFNVYGQYLLIDFLSILISVVLFCAIPTKLLKSVKDKLYAFRERQLVRQTINRSRQILSGKLFDLSSVFNEMANAFNAFKKNALSTENAKKIMQKQVFENVCGECEYRARCKGHERSIKTGLSKIIDIGLAKGKLSLIDLPKELGDACLHPNNLLYALNKLLADLRSYAIENKNVNVGRELIAEQSLGVAEILRGLALETGSQLKFQSRLERSLAQTLFKNGFSISELLLYGEENNLTVTMITDMKEFSIPTLEKVISESLGVLVTLNERAQITERKCFLSFKVSCPIDVFYGISFAIKDGSEFSGDTHSVERISDNRVLIALSDGMGSGERAQNFSSTALSLIESFYKAGLSSTLILQTVNKLLSINSEDCFTALDLAVIDLNNLTIDFIKYGCPYGFIINEQGIKIVEGNSLPLGILNELKPAVCSAPVSDGDVILLVSDGISDAFQSSGDLIDFLRTQPAKNPQSLSDALLEHAIKLNAGQKKDDMTALAVRIFKRTTA
ncbi:MAG: hypothetical protein E7347_01070 [Clostridiales bacterium]|nr:hypothetical protein [Clostridiales bacterium]